jgi:hypothetical protein
VNRCGRSAELNWLDLGKGYGYKKLGEGIVEPLGSLGARDSSSYESVRKVQGAITRTETDAAL